MDGWCDMWSKSVKIHMQRILCSSSFSPVYLFCFALFFCIFFYTCFHSLCLPAPLKEGEVIVRGAKVWDQLSLYVVLARPDEKGMLACCLGFLPGCYSPCLWLQQCQPTWEGNEHICFVLVDIRILFTMLALRHCASAVPLPVLLCAIIDVLLFFCFLL